jgi:hypothetical protein
MAKFDPFEAPQYSRAQCEQIFGANANGAVAQRLFFENAEMYADIKRESIRIGLLGPGSIVEKPAPYQPVVKTPVESHSDSDLEVISRPGHDYESVKVLWTATATGAKRNIGRLAVESPAEYKSLKRAAQIHGLLPRDPSDAQAATQEPRREGFRLSDSMARKANLPLGTHVSAEQFAKISETLTERANADAAKSEEEVVS